MRIVTDPKRHPLVTCTRWRLDRITSSDRVDGLAASIARKHFDEVLKVALLLATLCFAVTISTQTRFVAGQHEPATTLQSRWPTRLIVAELRRSIAIAGTNFTERTLQARKEQLNTTRILLRTGLKTGLSRAALHARAHCGTRIVLAAGDPLGRAWSFGAAVETYITLTGAIALSRI